MNYSSLVYFALRLEVIWMICSAYVSYASGTNPMPEVVLQAGPSAQFLWEKVQEGSIYKSLPPLYANDQEAWTSFLGSEGRGILQSYYSFNFNSLRFFDLLSTNQPQATSLGSHVQTKAVAEHLVGAFATKQPRTLAERMAERSAAARSAAERSAAESRAAESRAAESRAAESRAAESRAEERRAAERRDWGKTLKLG
ncbi:conserved hypothetical Ustilaginaceae-specific protein [Sporisorium reilianum SRZ2]|uniref:Conserved hypothetical Ustilaginaceae-specific protein n=1 Tax=Sporisorium reilianum (strain SRZ2) TaxID=999809 RepID=E7A098_SPORE|nr:conserved hypothetical Ustilaginaceae-specific protein [Sporisorium reilianum SRZ2]